jgi:hypothetical protein
MDVWFSQADLRGWVGVISIARGGFLADGDLVFLDDDPFLGWEATLPLFCGVPVMNTRSLSYPSHSFPLAMHLWQWGLSLLHYLVLLIRLDSSSTGWNANFDPSTSARLAAFVFSGNSNHNTNLSRRDKFRNWVCCCRNLCSRWPLL